MLVKCQPNVVKVEIAFERRLELLFLPYTGTNGLSTSIEDEQ